MKWILHAAWSHIRSIQSILHNLKMSDLGIKQSVVWWGQQEAEGQSCCSAAVQLLNPGKLWRSKWLAELRASRGITNHVLLRSRVLHQQEFTFWELWDERADLPSLLWHTLFAAVGNCVTCLSSSMLNDYWEEVAMKEQRGNGMKNLVKRKQECGGPLELLLKKEMGTFSGKFQFSSCVSGSCFALTFPTSCLVFHSYVIALIAPTCVLLFPLPCLFKLSAPFLLCQIVIVTIVCTCFPVFFS